MVLEMSEKSMGDAKISYDLYHSEAPAKVWEASRLAKQAHSCCLLTSCDCLFALICVTAPGRGEVSRKGASAVGMLAAAASWGNADSE